MQDEAKVKSNVVEPKKEVNPTTKVGPIGASAAPQPNINKGMELKSEAKTIQKGPPPDVVSKPPSPSPETKKVEPPKAKEEELVEVPKIIIEFPDKGKCNCVFQGKVTLKMFQRARIEMLRGIRSRVLRRKHERR